MGNKFIFSVGRVEGAGLLPDFCDIRVIFMVILLAEILAIVLAIASPATALFWDNLAFFSVVIQWISLFNAAILCLARRWLNKLALKTQLVASFCLMMLVSFVFTLILSEAGWWFDLLGNTSPLGEYFMLRMLAVSAVIYAVVLRYLYIQYQWKQNLTAHAKAELQALKARIRPHFLFNSMNTIASLIAIKPELAEKAVEDLSDLFRASLHEKTLHTLADELDLVRSYLDIEVLRLGKRLQIECNIDDGIKDEEIPALCLQPLAENAIYHGIEPFPDGGKLTISAQRQGNELVLSVSNPKLSENGAGAHHGNHMAQDNIRQRLQLLYEGRAGFYINETKEEYFITLKIPLDEP